MRYIQDWNFRIYKAFSNKRVNPDMVKALALVVPLSRGQAAVSKARNTHLIDLSLKIFPTRNELWIPLARPIDDSEFRRLSTTLGPIRIDRREFSARSRHPRTLAEALKGRLPSHLAVFVPKSFDIIGHIAILELPEQLASVDELVGKGVLEICPNVQTVMAKAGAFSSDYRTRDLRLIAGEDNPVTCYKEHGCVFELDVRTVFFSSRLGHERLRVATQVQPGERVIDMFAGVGPYSIIIGKKQPLSTVYAIDANPSAFRFLVSNILANKVLRNVRPLMGDAREVAGSRLSKTADRVIMNLPGSALEYVDVACSSLKEHGGVIHYYSFESAETPHEAAATRLEKQVKASGRELKSISAIRTVKEIAPYRFQVAVDACVE